MQLFINGKSAYVHVKVKEHHFEHIAKSNRLFFEASPLFRAINTNRLQGKCIMFRFNSIAVFKGK